MFRKQAGIEALPSVGNERKREMLFDESSPTGAHFDPPISRHGHDFCHRSGKSFHVANWDDESCYRRLDCFACTSAVRDDDG